MGEEKYWVNNGSCAFKLPTFVQQTNIRMKHFLKKKNLGINPFICINNEYLIKNEFLIK
jgi:hypothetical protein